MVGTVGEDPQSNFHAGSLDELTQLEVEGAECLLVGSGSKGVEAALLLFDPRANFTEPPTSLLGAQPTLLDLLEHVAQLIGMPPMQEVLHNESMKSLDLVHICLPPRPP